MSKKIADILQSIIPEDVAWKLKLLRAWPDIVGKLAERVSIFSIEETRLTLQTSHAAWAQELNFLAPLILQKISGLIGQGIIRTISFKIIGRQSRYKPSSLRRNAHSLHSPAPAPYSMTMQELSKLDALQDAQLREVLHSYLLRTKARM
jgi:hypothetical protein